LLAHEPVKQQKNTKQWKETSAHTEFTSRNPERKQNKPPRYSKQNTSFLPFPMFGLNLINIIVSL